MKTYKEASEILEKIKGAKNILLSLHIGADPDSAGANLAMYHALVKLGKNQVEIISPDEPSSALSFLPGFERIRSEDIFKKDLSNFDLLIALDAQGPGMLTRVSPPKTFPDNLKVVVADHHYTNLRFGEINLVDDIGSVGELLYNLFNQWGLNIDKEIATCLLTGIAGDTGTFRFASQTTADTLKAASSLIELGASLGEITFNLYKRNSVETLRAWGMVLENLKVEKVGKTRFVWASLSFESLKDFGGAAALEGITTAFFGTVEDTDFGALMYEEERGWLRGSLRSRTGFNVADIAMAIGGAGHKVAAGFRIKGEFSTAVDSALDTIRKIVKEKKDGN